MLVVVVNNGLTVFSVCTLDEMGLQGTAILL